MLIIGIGIGVVAGVLLAVLMPALWKKWTAAAAEKLNKPAP